MNSQLLSRFSRIKGSGPFSLAEFSALTGLPAPQALAVISIGEQRGLVICLAEGFYLLKPFPAPAKRTWQDWRPPRAKLQAFLDLIPKKKWLARCELAEICGLSDTLITRYTRILLFGGYIRRTRKTYRFYFQKLVPTLKDIPSWYQVLAASSAPTSQPLDPSTSRLEKK